MAKITDEIKEKILADFHTGKYTIRELGKKYDVSHTTVMKMTKGLEPKNKEKVATLIAIETDLAGQSFQEVSSVREAVDTATKHLIYFQNRALANQKKADELLEFADDLADIDAHSRITARNKETVLGKSPETIINNTQQQAQTTQIQDLNLENLSDDEIITLNAILEKAN